MRQCCVPCPSFAFVTLVYPLIVAGPGLDVSCLDRIYQMSHTSPQNSMFNLTSLMLVRVRHGRPVVVQLLQGLEAVVGSKPASHFHNC